MLPGNLADATVRLWSLNIPMRCGNTRSSTVGPAAPNSGGSSWLRALSALRQAFCPPQSMIGSSRSGSFTSWARFCRRWQCAFGGCTTWEEAPGGFLWAPRLRLIALPLVVIGVYLFAVGLVGRTFGGLVIGIVEAISGGGGSADSTVEALEGFFLMGLALTGVGAIGMIAGAVFAIILIVYLASPGEMGYNKYGQQPMLWQGKG